MIVASKNMLNYFEEIDTKVKFSYDFANKAKKNGFDPEQFVDIPLVQNMMERVVGLISIIAPQIIGKGVEQRIEELEKQYGRLDWRVALTISLEVAQEKFCNFKDKLQAMEMGIRIGLAYVTLGVVVSPLEGFSRLELKKRNDGKEYFALYYAGPIRSAGGTASSVSVVVADYIRLKMGYDKYDPSKEEVNRSVSEVKDYHERITNLQYLPSDEEIVCLASNIPVQITGDASEKIEVSNYKDLSRIGTNLIRNGFCLVFAECFAQKAKKVNAQIQKWGKDFFSDEWNFLDEFLKIQQKNKAQEKTDDNVLIKPDYTYIKDLVAGRPVFTHPLAKGGFRLRYGRGRNTGLSGQAIHPITMYILNKFIAIGTQLKVERPGKASVVGSCDSIEGPIVKLKSGEVLLLEDFDHAKKISGEIEEILFLGDILINFGDFLNRAHKLIPIGYNEEWWNLESGINKKNITVEEAKDYCLNKKLPLHPRYTFRWTEINIDQFIILINWFKNSVVQDEKIILPLKEHKINELPNEHPKRILELIGAPHKVVLNEHVVIEGEWKQALMLNLGDFSFDETLLRKAFTENKRVLDILNLKSGYKIRDKSGTTIGCRMGRPEKAKMRKLTGSPQILFPVGEEGGRLRSFQAALGKGKINSHFAIFHCEKCNKEEIYPLCETCGSLTVLKHYCNTCKKVTDKEECCNRKTVRYKSSEIKINDYFDRALKKLEIGSYHELIKGVRGTSGANHLVEHLSKGILRAKYGLYVNKDGTIRYDMTEMPLTHFKSKEVCVGIDKLKQLGYEKDVYGNDLVNEEQILELRCQDIVIPCSPDTLDEKCDDVMFKICKFIDELLIKLYKVDSFYNLKNKEDLVGQLCVGMSPHTSSGIVCRIIGFSKTQGLLAHPYLHSLMRRDCDGDESCIMLLMDVLLNFSKKFLPNTKGATQDEPLLLSSKLLPTEVDDMVFDMDVAFKYPIELYEAALQYKNPSDVKISKVKDFLDTEKQYEGFGFTHDTSDINKGVVCSAYKSIPSMEEKVKGQLDLAKRIRAVEESDVARLIIEKHFIRDIKGNLRKFSTQQFRCVECNEKYRRPPLQGNCLKCGGKLLFTVAEGFVLKYLEISLNIAEKYHLPNYLKQNLYITKKRIEALFGKEKDKQKALIGWFN